MVCVCVCGGWVGWEQAGGQEGGQRRELRGQVSSGHTGKARETRRMQGRCGACARGRHTPSASATRPPRTCLQQAAAHSHHHLLNGQQLGGGVRARGCRAGARVDDHAQPPVAAAVLQPRGHQPQALPTASICCHPVRHRRQRRRAGGLLLLCRQAGLGPKVADPQAAAAAAGCWRGCGVQAQQRPRQRQLASLVLLCREPGRRQPRGAWRRGLCANVAVCAVLVAAWTRPAAAAAALSALAASPRTRVATATLREAPN